MSAKPKPLQQIQRLEQTPIPPLSQWRYETMACECQYVARNIEGVRSDSEAARRGQAIHRIIADYVRHLERTKQKTDYNHLNVLYMNEPEEVREVLETFMYSFHFEYDQVFATELYIALDERFNSTLPDVYGPSEDAPVNTAPIIYEGTLDLVTLESETAATIHDWKSYFQIVDADTFQSKLYPLLLFSLNPALRTVKFKLDFVRYGDASREVTYTRDDVPKLKAIVQRERAAGRSCIISGAEPMHVPVAHAWEAMLLLPTFDNELPRNEDERCLRGDLAGRTRRVSNLVAGGRQGEWTCIEGLGY